VLNPTRSGGSWEADVYRLPHREFRQHDIELTCPDLTWILTELFILATLQSLRTGRPQGGGSSLWLSV